MEKLCDNCGKETNMANDKILFAISAILQDDGNDSLISNEMQIEITTVLSIIFEQNPSMFKHNQRRSNINCSIFKQEQGNLYFCTTCSENLKLLYRGFVQLLELSQINSKFMTKLSQSYQIVRQCAHVQLNDVKSTPLKSKRYKNQDIGSSRKLSDKASKKRNMQNNIANDEVGIDIKVEVESQSSEEYDTDYYNSSSAAIENTFEVSPMRSRRKCAVIALQKFEENVDVDLDEEWCVKPQIGKDTDNDNNHTDTEMDWNFNGSEPSGSDKNDSDYENDNEDNSSKTRKNNRRNRRNNSNSEFACSECPKAFRYKTGLRRHMREAHSDFVHKCIICKEEFKRKGSLNDHLTNVHKIKIENEHKCDICNRAFVRPSLLLLHLESSHRVRSDLNVDVIATGDDKACKVCSRQFITKSGLKRHEREMHTGVTFKCPFEKCSDRTFNRKDYVREHLKAVHNGEKLEEFYEKSKNLVLQKERKKPETLKIKCLFEDCSEIFSKRNAVIKHLISSHNGERIEEFNSSYSKEKLQCNLCQKVFGRDSALNSHMEVHKNLKLECPFEACKGKTFARRDYIRDHIHYVHNGEGVEKFYTINLNGTERKRTRVKRIKNKYKPRVNCEQCGNSIQKDRLKEHMLTHSGEKPHLCELCGQSYRTKSSLSTHKRDVHHINVTEYPCTHCHRIFTRPGTRRIHEDAMHGDPNRVFICDQCGKGYRHEKNLKEHLALHNDDIGKRTCQTCKKIFSRISNLRLHVRAVHNGEKVYNKKILDDPNRIIVKRNRLQNSLEPSSSTNPPTSKRRRKELEDYEEDSDESQDEEESNEPQYYYFP